MLERFQLVAGDDHLIAGHDEGHLFGATALDVFDVGNRRQVAVRLRRRIKTLLLSPVVRMPPASAIAS